MNAYEQLDELFRREEVPSFGVCRFADTLPLIPCRAVSRIPESAASVIAAVFPYYTGDYPGRNLARYALGEDYHRIAGAVLDRVSAALSGACPGEAFLPFVDASPIREVEAARLAGLGDVGRNGLLIHPLYGSHVFLGCIVTTLKLEPSPTPGGTCRDCGLCLARCPTGALTEEGFVPRRCRSHITQKKGRLSPWEAGQVRAGGLLWGCDICLDACPHNSGAAATPIRAFAQNIQPRITNQNLETLHPVKACNYRGPQVLRRNLDILSQRDSQIPEWSE